MRVCCWIGRITVLTLALTVAAPASAAGRGGYVGFGTGDSEWDVEGWEEIHGETMEADTTSPGVGLVLDSGPAKDSLFGYRVEVGYSSTEHNFDFEVTERLPLTPPSSGEFTPVTDDGTIAGVAQDNTFAFAFRRSGRTHLWAGPLLRLGLYSGDLHVDYSQWMVLLVPGFPPVRSVWSDDERYDLDMVEGKFDGAFGANFNRGRKFTLGLTIGFL